ncbi:MAG TPA: N-acetyl-1-D-myo-inositol-2-amino-2-deoxy-alpha-D-glucopyranoside deacetylase [Dermatophilaceae bacterium]|nr:N-acetyl-1-D-myo-inositol-2-amino-2-deoxy-alpha-D-glucopyranoside deacetylase [Dermatophilaceae bacterium]
MSPVSPVSHRLLFIHAHPDDESLTCGIAMAHHVARGDEVHVLTCTLGEEGEVIPPALSHLEGHPEDALGPHRYGELAEALGRLGARMHVLGATPTTLSRYRDSGMAGSEAAGRDEAFVRANLDEAARMVAGVIRHLRPHVVVTYDAQGGYGHPDHIQTHRVTRAALDLVEDDDLPERVFEIVTPRRWAIEDRRWLRANVRPEWGLTLLSDDDPYPPSVVRDEHVTHTVEDPTARDAKNAALRAHATQVLVLSDEVYALSNLVAARTTAREAFTRVDPRTWRRVGGDGIGQSLTE